MSFVPDDPTSRRSFLGFIAASPLFAAAGAKLGGLDRLIAGSPRDHARALELLQQAVQDAAPISAANQALNVFDFEPIARKKLPPAHWGYLATGSDDDGTIRANRDGMSRYELRVRRLVDTSKVDTQATLLGTTYQTPIIICPVGSQRAFHPDGELAVARAAKAKDHLQVLSTVATTSIEAVIAARGGPVLFQLYTQPDFSKVKQMLSRAERAGAPAVVWTVDLLGGSNRETMKREALRDTRTCSNCHAGGRPQPGVSGRVDDRDNSRKPMLAGLQPSAPMIDMGTPTWDYIKRLKDATSMKVFVKGIVTREDAELAMEHGVDGLFVSNHGGRAEASQRATINCVSDVVAGVAGRAPVEVDGGFRRGTDIFKGLALGASAVGIGRPYIWGLASFGQEGVETVLALLRKELETVMKQAGTTSIRKITREYVVARA